MKKNILGNLLVIISGVFVSLAAIFILFLMYQFFYAKPLDLELISKCEREEFGTPISSLVVNWGEPSVKIESGENTNFYYERKTILSSGPILFEFDNKNRLVGKVCEDIW
jgi:hypothetical protein